MRTHVILEDVDVADAPDGSVVGLLCYECHASLPLPKVDRAAAEEAARLGRTSESADFFSRAMMAAYKTDLEVKRAITVFLLTHEGHFITPVLMLDTTAPGGSS